MTAALPDPRDHFPAGTARLAHILQVVATAREIEARESFDGALIAAATYHDIGYAPAFRVTGYHPVDGAARARADGQPETVVEAVLCHSGAHGEVRRAFPHLLDRYPAGCRMMATRLARATTFCDLRSGPDGARLDLDARLADILARHADKPALAANIAAYRDDFAAIDAEFGPLLG